MSARALARRRTTPRLPPELLHLAPVLHQREWIAAIVDALVELLDTLDGDPDAEPDHEGEADAEGELSAVVPVGLVTVGSTVPQLPFARRVA